MYREAITLAHGEQLYTDLLARIRRDADQVAAMWADAESVPDELDVPGTLAALAAAHPEEFTGYVEGLTETVSLDAARRNRRRKAT
jgi:hypothetical protein